MVGALFVMNQVYGCSTRRRHAGGAGFSRDAGFDVPADVSAADAAQAAADARYDVNARRDRRRRAADEVVAGQEFIFDVQTHNRVPAPPWNAATCTTNTPNMCPTAYLSGIFVDSDTHVACLSGYPARAPERRAVDPGARADQGNRRPRSAARRGW